jgi:hypothetical protein
MAGRRDDDQPILANRSSRQRRIVDFPFDEADFGNAVMHGLAHGFRVADLEMDADRRIGGAQAHQRRRQPVAGDRLARLDLQRAAHQPAQLRQRQLCRLRARQRCFRLDEEDLARLVQFDAPADTIEQVRTSKRVSSA